MIRRAIAVVKKPRRIGARLAQARAVVLALRDNPDLPALPVPLAAFDASIQQAFEAHALTLTRTKGTREDREAKLAVVSNALRRIQGAVQHAADDAGEEGAAVIERAGLQVKRRGTRSKANLTARRGPVSGEARLVAKSAGDRVSYEWQRSFDGVTWSGVPSTRKANTVVRGLTPGVWVYFRHRVVTKDGVSDWGQAVSLLVT